MKKLIILTIVFALLSCKKEKISDTVKKDSLGIAGTFLIEESCDDKGTPFFALDVCTHSAFIGIYDPNIPNPWMQKNLMIWTDSTGLKITNKKITLDSAGFWSNGTASTGYIMAVDPSSKSITKLSQSSIVSNAAVIAALGFTPSSGLSSVGLNSSDFTISNSPLTSNGSITANLKPSGVTAGTYEFVTVNSKGIVTGGYNSVTNDLSARTSGTAYQASNTSRTYDLDFTLKINIGATLISSSDGEVRLEISPNGSTGWVEYGAVQNNNGAILGALNGGTCQVIANNIPAGYYYRLIFGQISGTASWTYRKGHETLRR